MGTRRFTSMVVGLLVGCALLWGASAQALTVHVFAGSFGSEGSGSGEFKEPLGVAVNDVTGDVYVVDSGNDRVVEFNSTGSTVLAEFNGSASPTGAFSGPTQIAVDNSDNPLDPSSEDVYVVDREHGVIDKFSASGTYLGQLTGTPNGAFARGENGITGVAVDPSGVVWVATGPGPIYSFSDALANQYVSQLLARGDSGEPINGFVEGLAVDSEDNLYIHTENNIFIKVNSSGELLSSTFADDREKLPTAVAVDPVGHEVYLDNAGEPGSFESIEAFSLTGAPIESSESGAEYPSGFGSGHLTFSRGLTVNSSDSTVYVTDHYGDRVAIFEGVTLPGVSTGAASEQQPRSVTLNGTVDPEGKPVSSCVFEYGTSSAYGQSVPCSPASLGSGSSPVAVSVHLTGLVPEEKYHYRLVAENAAHVPSATPDKELTTGPVLGGESVTNVASSSATLQATIDPNGADTHYYFQYGTTESYGTDAPLSPPGVDIGSGLEGQTLSLHLQGLEPGTVYHYRVAILQGGETFTESDQTFTTQATGGELTLPDGRAWELVSPPNKKGALIETFATGDSDAEIQAASDGSGITYLSKGPSVGEDPEGNGLVSQVLSVRVPGGWSSQDLTVRAPRISEAGEEGALGVNEFRSLYPVFSSDLSLAIVEPPGILSPLLSPEATEDTLYLRDDSNGSFTPLVDAGNVPAGTRFGPLSGSDKMYEEETYFVAATPDLSHIVFKSPYALTENAVTEASYVGREQWNLYEWSEGRLQLVNILPDGETTRGSEPGVRLGGGGSNEGDPYGFVPRAISNDGRRIAWDWGEPFGEGANKFNGLFVRDMVEERTVKVGGPHAIFQTMNADGSEIFFLEEGDLYVYDFETGTQTDLTADHSAGESNGGVLQSVSDVSEDGSYVYFVATGVLANANGAVSGGDNLYLAHDDGGEWSTTYIATLSPEDESDWYDNSVGYAPELAGVSSRVSPNGRYLAFMSERSLTGYDNIDAVSGQPDEEVYLYDADTGRLTCASCDPTGARPVGVHDVLNAESLLVDRNGTWNADHEGIGGIGDKGIDHWLAGSIPSWVPGHTETKYQSRFLSDSGRLFFDSPDALVPQATNGLEDVYEYEPEGVGGCVSALGTFSERSGGCVGLISAGTSSSESAFLDASENGDDVFFITTSKLVAADYDNGYDVYDAHVCSVGVPCVSEAVSPPPCDSGDSCKAAPSPQPEIFGPTPSATFSGVGNVVEEAKASKAKAKPKKKKAKKKPKKKKKKGKGKARVGRKSGVVRARRSGASVVSGKGSR